MLGFFFMCVCVVCGDGTKYLDVVNCCAVSCSRRQLLRVYTYTKTLLDALLVCLIKLLGRSQIDKLLHQGCKNIEF